ncbi:MAG TPA: hypothetical protein VIX89_05135 [Bryobacteraceae bacterium]
MNAIPVKYTPSKSNAMIRRVRPRQDSFSGAQAGFLQPLLQTIIQIKNAEGGRGVFAFTSPGSGDGVSHVLQIVAQELASQNRCRVLTASSAMLDGAADDDIQRALRGCIERAPSVWSLVDDDHVEYMPEALLDRLWVDVTPRDFDFILIDCPPLNEVGDALRLGHETDGVFLVVSAGETRRDQIEHAQKILRHSSARLQGLVLNRRTYPVPNFLYKLL